jgi:hypothetical protein
MISAPIVHQILDNPNRLKYVFGASIMLLLLLGLPAFDKFQMQQVRAEELREEISELERELENGDFVRKRLIELRNGKPTGETWFDNESAMALREEVVRLTRESRCRLLSVHLSDIERTPWTPDMNPLREQTNQVSDDVRFNLEKTRLTLAVEGPLHRIDNLIAAIRTLHQMAVPTDIVIRKASDNQTVKVDLTLSLLGLSAT